MRNSKKYRTKAVRRALVLCWIALVACLAIKIFIAPKYFEAICTNPVIEVICDFLDNNPLAQAFVYYPLNLLSNFLLLLMMCRKKKFDKFHTIFTLALITAAFATKYGDTEWGFIFDIVVCFLYPIALTIREKWAWLRVLIVNILTIAYQIIYLFIKNITISPTFVENSFLGLITMIDFYIIHFMGYLYLSHNDMDEEQIEEGDVEEDG